MTKVSWRAITTGLVAVWALSMSALAFQGAKGDPVIGTWTLNVAKSKFDPGPAPKSGTVTFMLAGEGVHVVADIVGADGTVHTDYTASYDGTDYPLKGVPGADTVSLKRIDATSSQRTDKMGGKVVGTWTRKVSADGKTMTVTYSGTDAKGQKANNVMVFDRKS
jgi:hypothetical protein